MMKNSFFQDRTKLSRRAPWGKNLFLEPLEERALLSASDWGGFERTPIVNNYEILAQDILIDVGGNIDLAAVGNVNSDDYADLITVDKTASTITVYFNSSTNPGDFTQTAAVTTALTRSSVYDPSVTLNLLSDSSGIALGDVNGDSLVDLIVVSQEDTLSETLVFRVYLGRQDGSFLHTTAQKSEISLDAFKASSVTYNNPVVTTVNLTTVDANLAVQISAMDYSGKTINGIVVYQNTYSTGGKAIGRFVEAGAVKVTTDNNYQGTIQDTITLGGTETLVSLDTVKRGFWFTSGENWNVNGFLSFSSVLGTSVMSINWAAAADGVLYFGGEKDGVATDAVVQLSGSGTSIEVVASAFYGLWLSGGEQSFIMNSNSVVSLGDLNGDGFIDLVNYTGGNYLPLLGVASQTTGLPAFVVGDSVITQPDYLATYVGNLLGTDATDLLLVGSVGIWTVDGADLTAQPVILYEFDTSAKEAVFGDFNNDGLIDIAVRCGDAGGSQVGIYLQSKSGDSISFERAWWLDAPGDGQGYMTNLTVGKFTQSVVDELAVFYTWNSQTTYPVLAFYNLTVSTSAQATFSLASLATPTALVAGKVYGSNRDDLVLAYASESSIAVVKNSAGTFTEQTVVVFSTISLSYQPTALAVGDIDGDSLADVVFLNSGSGKSDGAIGYILQDATSGFLAENVSYGANIDKAGTPVGLLLTDLSADGLLDVVTTVTGTDGKSSVFVALNTGAEGAIFATPAKQSFSGDYRNGFDFDGGTISGPFLAAGQFGGDESFGDVVMVKGKTVFVLRSRAEQGEFGDYYYVVRSAESSAKTGEMADPTTQTDIYSWIDEWTSFYIEIWATTDGNGGIDDFSASFSYSTQYYSVKAANVESGINGFTVTSSIEEDETGGSISILGTGTGIYGDSGYILLTRVKVTPRGGVGVELPDSGVFDKVASELVVFDESYHSLNENDGVELVEFDDPDLFAVRNDFNDDGVINLLDYNHFVNNYLVEKANWKGSVEYPLVSRYALFDYDKNDVLNIVDYNYFVDHFLLDVTSTVNGFYRDAKKDPNTEWPAAASVPTMSSETTVLPAVSSNSAIDEALCLLDKDDAESEVFTVEKTIIPLAESQAVLFTRQRVVDDFFALSDDEEDEKAPALADDFGDDSSSEMKIGLETTL